jgi:acyl-CoA thioester hydrolase
MVALKAQTSVRVRYGETDQMGVVHHVHYFNYFEVARIELLRECGFTYKEVESAGYFLVVTETTCKYLKPAYYDDLLQIQTWISLLSTVRLHFEYEIFREKELLIRGSTRLGCLSREHYKPTAIPEALKKALSRYSCGQDLKEEKSEFLS